MIVRGYKSGTVIDYETTYNTLPEKKNGYRMPIVSNELKKDQTLIESDVISGTPAGSWQSGCVRGYCYSG